MESQNPIHARAAARDAALRKLNRLTAGVAVGALAGVSGLAVVSAETIAGTSTPTPTATTSSPTSSAPVALQPSSGVTSSSSPPHVVTGGS
jgi:hypothetical protein